MDFVQLLATGGLIGALVTAASVITQVVLNKKLRTPADRQSEITNVFNILNGTIQDNRADKAANEATIEALREYVGRLENDARTDNALIRDLEQQIRVLEQRNWEKDQRIATLEAELAKYAGQVLSAIEESSLPEELEETKNQM